MKEQFIHIDEDGHKCYYSDRQMTILHREDGPAVEDDTGYKSYFIDGMRHREDGPSVEWESGDKEWWINNKLHREDGPAIEYACGSEGSWYINGKRLTEEEFDARMNPVELTLEEIAEKFGVSVDKLKLEFDKLKIKA